MSFNFEKGPAFLYRKIPRIACGGRRFFTLVLPIEKP
jgi:hypothetical protein